MSDGPRGAGPRTAGNHGRPAPSMPASVTLRGWRRADAAAALTVGLADHVRA
jgi:hypothetical protein